jgi:hypothetical protein
MSPECDDCGETFETFSRLRLHDCSPANDAESDEHQSSDTSGAEETPEAQQLATQIASLNNGDYDTVYQALATYESVLARVHESGNTERYQTLSRAHRESLIEGVDEAVQAEGWSLLEEAIEAYHPAASEEFPHVTTTLQNVASRHMIRTRVAESVAEIPVTVLEYFASILEEVGALQDFICEGLHPYGWGIGHPDHSVADRLHTHAKDDLILVGAVLEHAFYADQHAGMDLLERILQDETIQHDLSYPPGDNSMARSLLDAPAGAASDFSPTMPRYWDWQEELEYSFELADDIEARIRDIVVETGIDDDLPEDWDVTALTL